MCTSKPNALYNIILFVLCSLIYIRSFYSSYVQRTGKMRCFSEAMRPLWPLLVFLVIMLLWPFISPNNIMEKDPRIMFLLSGTIFSNISVSMGTKY